MMHSGSRQSTAPLTMSQTTRPSPHLLLPHSPVTPALQRPSLPRRPLHRPPLPRRPRPLILPLVLAPRKTLSSSAAALTTLRRRELEGQPCGRNRNSRSKVLAPDSVSPVKARPEAGPDPGGAGSRSSVPRSVDRVMQERHGVGMRRGWSGVGGFIGCRRNRGIQKLVRRSQTTTRRGGATTDPIVSQQCAQFPWSWYRDLQPGRAGGARHAGGVSS
jgi:hypothetical protein